MNTVATNAIERSVSHTEIVHVAHDADVIEALTSECDDHIEGNDEHEFWGTTEDGSEWRVHVTLA